MFLYKRSHDEQPDGLAISSFTVNNAAYSNAAKERDAFQNPTYDNGNSDGGAEGDAGANDEYLSVAAGLQLSAVDDDDDDDADFEC